MTQHIRESLRLLFYSLLLTFIFVLLPSFVVNNSSKEKEQPVYIESNSNVLGNGKIEKTHYDGKVFYILYSGNSPVAFIKG